MSLVDVTVRLAAQHDEETVLRTVTETVCEALRCERASMTNPPLRTRDGRTRTARIGLATAVVALSSLSACSMWHGMTDRIAGRGTSSDTARATRPATSTAGPSGGTWGGGAGMPS
nr:hypothetical protein [Burkholderiaceae bacterium]